MRFDGRVTDTVFEPPECDSTERILTRGAMSRLGLSACRQLLAEMEEEERTRPPLCTKLRTGSFSICLVIDPKITDPHSFAFFSGSSPATAWRRAPRL